MHALEIDHSLKRYDSSIFLSHGIRWVCLRPQVVERWYWVDDANKPKSCDKRRWAQIFGWIEVDIHGTIIPQK